MSVLSCSRYGCRNVMCDIHIPSEGYICDDCAQEFIAKTPGYYDWQTLSIKISEFIQTNKENLPEVSAHEPFTAKDFINNFKT